MMLAVFAPAQQALCSHSESLMFSWTTTQNERARSTPLQIGLEKHRMLNLFMQVPRLVRTRLAKRCRELYDYMLRTTRGDGEDDEDNGPQQVRTGTDSRMPDTDAATPAVMQPQETSTRQYCCRGCTVTDDADTDTQ